MGCANRVGDYLIANKNGWFEMKGTGSNPMENLVILSEQHREGHISFGDVIALRAHNGRFVTAAPDGHVEAVTNDMNDDSMWTIYGTLGASSGYVHSRDRVMFRGDSGFISSKASPSGEHVRSDTNDRSEAVWTLKKVWEKQCKSRPWPQQVKTAIHCPHTTKEAALSSTKPCSGQPCGCPGLCSLYSQTLSG